MKQEETPDLQLLRMIYRHLDKDALLAERPDVEADDLIVFFRKLRELLAASEPSKETVQSPSQKPATSGGPRLILYSDGGSRGNPGNAGYGAVLTDETGRILDEASDCIGTATNNEAEYNGLLAGLKMAAKHAPSELLVRADSELIVRQLNGQYKVKSRGLVPLFLEVRRLLDTFPSWRVEHIPREQNVRADMLANAAMDKGKG